MFLQGYQKTYRIKILKKDHVATNWTSGMSLESNKAFSVAHAKLYVFFFLRIVLVH